MISVGENQNMERKINDELFKWKRDSLNKPLFLYGPRCVGKTYSILTFGEKYYQNVAYFNMYNNIEVINILEKEKKLDRLFNKLSLICGESIFKKDTLVVFDNCNDEKLIKLLKIFGTNNLDYPVVIISNNRLLANKLHIEEFYYRNMMPMDFFEYLSNTDKVGLIDFIIDSYENSTPMPFHQMAMDAYYEYLETGGFPEVINAKLNNESDYLIDSIKLKILDIYRSEYSMYNDGSILPRCEEIFKFLPLTLIKENKKFQYGIIRKGARSKEYEESINYLVGNSILARSYKLNDIKSPIMSCKDLESFKLYFNDVGLLYTLLHVNKSKFLMDNDLRRSLIECDVANSLIKLGYTLYYYQSDGKAEINFVIQNRQGKIIPIEVVNMRLSKAKAMSLFLNKFNISDSIRLTEDNFSKKKGVRMIPVYAISLLKDL